MDNDPYSVAQVVEVRRNPSRNPIVFWILLIAGGASLLFVACAGLCGASFYFGTKSIAVASDRVDEFFDAIEQDRFGDLYDNSVSASYRKVMTREKHAEMGESIGRHLGGLQSKTMQNFNSSSYNGQGQVSVVYNAAFEKGTGTIHMKIIWEDGGWKFDEFRVQSPLFDKSITCVSCGSKYPAAAKFCPSCGKAVSEAK